MYPAATALGTTTCRCKHIIVQPVRLGTPGTTIPRHRSPKGKLPLFSRDADVKTMNWWEHIQPEMVCTQAAAM